MKPNPDRKDDMVLDSSLGIFWHITAFPVVLLVKIYRLFSPVKQLILGPYAACRFHPTCSEYALECLSAFSLPKALWMTLSRIGRCNPMHPGGFDPVIKAEKTDCNHE
jgi:putative membrane protein insertion efficiency factor